MKVLFAEPQLRHAGPFLALGHECHSLTNRESMSSYDLLVLGGGSDVDPSFYGEEPGPFTTFTPGADAQIFALLDEAAEAGTPVVGICKGAQQLCVYNGGSLHQHVGGHQGNHSIRLLGTDEVVHTYGNHHQMMVLGKVNNYELIAYADQTHDILYEPEIVYFPDNNSLGFQYHPEWMPSDSEGVALFFKLIEERLLCQSQ